MTSVPFHINVRAVPTGAEYLIECSDCGVVEVATHDECDERCLVHLEEHLVDTTEYRNRGQS